MTRRFSVLLLSVAAALFLAMPAFAQGTAVIVFTGVPSGEGTWGPFYAGIYDGTLNNVPTNFVCDDFTHEISNGYYWDANVNAPDSSGVRFSPPLENADLTTPGTYYAGNSDSNFGTTYYSTYTVPTGGFSRQQEYNMIGFLVGKIFSNSGNPGLQATLNGAIWAITDNAAAEYESDYIAGGSTSSEAWVEAAVAYANVVPTGLWVNTPNTNQFKSPPPGGTTWADGSAQEFWSTPEPPAVVLLGWGTLALALGSLVSKKFLA
jgi:hypothetical protein